MRRRWVEFGKQEPRLGTVGVADNKTGQRKSILHQFLLCVSHLLEKSLAGRCIPWHLLLAGRELP